jgi:hypothetical protein
MRVKTDLTTTGHGLVSATCGKHDAWSVEVLRASASISSRFVEIFTDRLLSLVAHTLQPATSSRCWFPRGRWRGGVLWQKTDEAA